jgi:hypothetical protein
VLEAFGSASLERRFDAIGQTLGVFFQPLPDVGCSPRTSKNAKMQATIIITAVSGKKTCEPIRMGEILVSRWNSTIA